jgi:hypothetical protein
LSRHSPSVSLSLSCGLCGRLNKSISMVNGALDDLHFLWVQLVDEVAIECWLFLLETWLGQSSCSAIKTRGTYVA